MARLARVPSRGGELEALTGGFASSGGGFSVWPDVLPGGVGVLFTRREGGAPANDSDLFLFLPETGEVRELVARAYHAKYAPSGHIVFVRDGSLWAIPFDLERLETAGAAVTVVENVDTNGLSGSSGYAFSDTGLLVYLPGGDIHDTLGRTFSWVGPNGEEEPLGIEPRSFDRPRLSPDRQQLAVAIDDVGNRDIWVYDLQRGTRNRLTISEETDDAPVWTPDGEKVVFSSTREGGGIFSRRADGAGGVERIGPNVESAFAGIFGLTPESIDPNQQWLVFREGQPSDLKMLSLGEDGEVVTLLDSEADEDYSEISPDGQYLAYESRQSGIEEVYVRPFPDVNDGRWWQVSLDGGQEPHWSPDGTRLFYRKGETLAIIAADVELEPTFSVTARRTVFEGGDVALNEPTYGISADGQRLLVMRAGERRAEPIVSTSLVVVDNWFEELRRLAPLAE